MMPAGAIPEAEYARIHALMPIVCVDLVVLRGASALLVRRRQKPAAGLLWLPGGRIRRGETVAGAAGRLLEGETGLSCPRFSFLGVGELGFPDEPFGHGKGTHSVTVVLSCRPRSAAVRLDGNHSAHVWAAPWMRGLHPYVRDFLRLASGRAPRPALRARDSGIPSIPEGRPVSYTMTGGNGG
jgi:ADP-ribose pyrophosphatase YjhB (NUDIX family)